MKSIQMIHLEAVKDGDLFYEKSIDSKDALYEFARTIDKNPDREKVYLLGVDNSSVPLFLELLAVGGIDKCLVDVRNVFKLLLLANCTSFFIWHNHLGMGKLTPSKEDWLMTKKLYRLGEFLNIKLNDHLVINDKGYVSIMEELEQEGEAA